MSVKDKVIVDKGLGVKFAEEVLVNAMRPLSPDQIKSKFKCDFPFTIQRVVRSPKNAKGCRHQMTGQVGELLTLYRMCEITGHYIYSETCTCLTWAIGPDGLCVSRDSERFILANDK